MDELADKIKHYEQQIMHLVNLSIKMQKLKNDEDEISSWHTDDSMDDSPDNFEGDKD